jgi:tetratricopeptide (TPR) repeat protein
MLYTLRGQMYLYLYEWDQVLADYNTAIELDPAYADAYYYRAVLYYTRNELNLALADFQHYLDLAPDGDHAQQAAQSIADIQTQQQALENS